MKFRFTLLIIICSVFSFSQDLKTPIDTAYVTNNSINIKGK